MLSKIRILSVFLPTFFVALFLFGCGQSNTKAVTPQLKAIFDRLNLKASDPPADKHKALQEIEAADAKQYGPTSWTLLLLESDSATSDSKGEIPRYWLLVEDYQDPSIAHTRALEYALSGGLDRAAAAYKKADRFMVSKETVRIWAVARGKRVYALTTDTYLYTLLKLPQDLRQRIEELTPQ